MSIIKSIKEDTKMVDPKSWGILLFVIGAVAVFSQIIPLFIIIPRYVHLQSVSENFAVGAIILNIIILLLLFVSFLDLLSGFVMIHFFEGILKDKYRSGAIVLITTTLLLFLVENIYFLIIRKS